MIKPIGKVLLIKEDIVQEQKETESGIVFGIESTQSSQRTETGKGEIISTGSIGSDLEQGQKVYFESHAGYPVTFKGENYKLVQEISILAVITDD